jgi:transcriptional regulator with XRE-family HTH domain
MTNAAANSDAQGPPSELLPDLADRLAKSLQVAGLSVAEMAQYLEAHRNTVGAWLNRRNQPRPANLRLWAMRTGVPYEWLRYGTWPDDQLEESEQVNT